MSEHEKDHASESRPPEQPPKLDYARPQPEERRNRALRILAIVAIIGLLLSILLCGLCAVLIHSPGALR